MRYKRKQSKTEKNKSVLHAEKHKMCAQKIRKSKYTQKIKQSYRILEFTVVCWTNEMLMKFIVREFFSCRRCFLSFHLKVKVVESLISSGIEDHTFTPIDFREHFPEEELTLGKNRFLEVASLVE